MKTDIEIARETVLKPISEIAQEIGIKEDMLESYGKYMAKVPLSLIDENKVKKSKLILVTAITPNKSGIGKTTVSVGLGLGLQKIGKKAIIALREPSLGPCFGMKGGATGGGYAQVLPMEKINLHFTGDFHAITSANNMISALLDNYIYQHQAEGFGMREILWKRVMDVNDRSLRQIITGLGPHTNGLPQQSGFDITPASEIMAILCLSKDLEDMKMRIGNILLGYTLDKKPFFVKDMHVEGAIAALLKDAINPNLVQTTEGGAAFIHGGPFANIAHGCNSIIATKMAMTFGDYAITEAGFGADLGAEKFYDIKCRKAGLQPALTIIVATIPGLKMHGDGSVAQGLANLDRHIDNIKNFGQTVLVCFNKFASDTEEEISTVREHCKSVGVPFALNDSYAKGGEGAVEFADLVVKTIEKYPSKPLEMTYSDNNTFMEKIESVAKKIYRADGVNISAEAYKKLEKAEAIGYGAFPVCIAKTQYSFSQDPKKYGVPEGFIIDIKDIVINSGSEMIVAIAGDIIRMPGLPKIPQALNINVSEGNIEGLS
ncbi:MAG: formate--tetrahydrofolate ligase [Candidatus Cryptobacteroides sp.]